jgi:RNA polymerase subunit RPABC4/transcription elongation factor Spt4
MSATKNCKSCGNSLMANMLFCPKCGSKNISTNTTEKLIISATAGGNQISNSEIAPKNISNPSLNNVAASGPKGIGGWLIVFLFSITIGPFAINTPHIYDLIVTLKLIDMSGTKLVFVLMALINILAILAGFYTAYLIYTLHPYALSSIKKILLWIYPSAVVVNLFLAYGLGGFNNVGAYEMIQIIFAVIFQIIITTIWWLYFKKSKRIKNTFGDF